MVPKTEAGRHPAIIFLYTLLFLLLLAWGILLQLNPAKNTFWNYAFNIGNGLLYLTGGIAAYAFVMKRAAGGIRRGAGLFALGHILWGIGSFIWTYYNLVLNVEVPFPSAADVFYLAFVVCYAIGLWHLSEDTEDTARPKNLRSALYLIFLCYGATFYVFWRMPLSDATFMESISSFIYPIIDTFVLAQAFVLAQVGRSGSRKSMFLVIAGIIIQLLGDYLFSYSEMIGVYWNGGLTDLFYTASGYILFLAVMSLPKKANG